MYPELFKIGNFIFYSHGFLAVMGIILGVILIYYLLKKSKVINNADKEYLVDNIIFSLFAAVIGARIIYFILYNWQFENLWEIFELWNGGMVSYGGFIIGAIVFVLLLKKQNQPVFYWLDLTSFGFFVGLFFGRIGNILAGEYSGRALVDNKMFLNYFNVVPIPLFEAFLALVILSSCYFVFSKYKLQDGIIFAISILTYTLGRFIIDFWRDEQKILSVLSLGQITSLLIFLFFVALLVILLGKSNKVVKKTDESINSRALK